MATRRGFPTPKTAKKLTESVTRITDRRDRALYVISVAAELSGVHPQTLRMYERKGLLSPKRTPGRARRYSDRDIEHVQLIQELTQGQGVNLAGVEIVMRLTRQVEEMRSQIERLRIEADEIRRSIEREVLASAQATLTGDE
jgi:MerR family transcriptional regulator/heat shock protein HspR